MILLSIEGIITLTCIIVIMMAFITCVRIIERRNEEGRSKTRIGEKPTTRDMDKFMGLNHGLENEELIKLLRKQFQLDYDQARKTIWEWQCLT